MIKKNNILIFPAGSEIGLEIHNSLKYNLHVELYGASGKSDHAKYIYDEDHYLEDDFYIDKPNFIDKLNAVINRFNIDYIFPTHDSIVEFLAREQANIKAIVLTSPHKTTLIAREKKRTYDLFSVEDFCPQVYDPPFENLEYPVFLKPNRGQGGKGTYLVHSKAELTSKTQQEPDLIACEFLPGEELSIDCFTNKDGKLLFVGPRARVRVEMGIAFTTYTVPLTEELQSLALHLNNNLVFRGAWFFQVKKDRNAKFKLLEFAARQASTMMLYRQVGINFALLSIFDAKGIDVSILNSNFNVSLDRCLHNSYKTDLKYNRVYIDFDDTIIIREKVNSVALSYMYQCKNKGIHITLITKHRYDLDETLTRYCLSKNLFDEIIILQENDAKFNFIKDKNSIFIDNYFFDREEVLRELGIPVFDVDAIECLLDSSSH